MPFYHRKYLIFNGRIYVRKTFWEFANFTLQTLSYYIRRKFKLNMLDYVFRFVIKKYARLIIFF